MPSQWDRKADFFKLSCSLSQECLNKRAGERKGNYNSTRVRREGAFLLAQDDKPVFLLSLSGPSTSTSLQNAYIKATASGFTQHHDILWIHTVVMPQLHLILPTDNTCTSHTSVQKQRKQENLTYQAMVYLWSDCILWLNHSPTTSITFSPPLGYQMWLAQFGMRHTQINILSRGATVESPCWVSKKNMLSVICSLSSHGCLDVVVCSGTGPLYPVKFLHVFWRN